VLSTGGKGKGVNRTNLSGKRLESRERPTRNPYLPRWDDKRETYPSSQPRPFRKARTPSRPPYHTQPPYPVYPLCVSPSVCQKGTPRPPANYLMPAAGAGLFRRAAPQQGAVVRVAAVTCPAQAVNPLVGGRITITITTTTATTTATLNCYYCHYHSPSHPSHSCLFFGPEGTHPPPKPPRNWVTDDSRG
jgi:hypothetical protein